MLRNKVAIVTGSGRGIGAEIAKLMAAHGARVIVNDVGTSGEGVGRDAGPAGEVAEQIRQAGGEAVANGDSVTSFEGATNMVKQALETYGGLHIIVNNAGILRDRMLHKMSPEDWQAVIDVHLGGHFNMCRAAINHFRQQNYGRIVNFTSTSGLIGNLGQTNYGTAKMGIVSFTRNLAMESARNDITVNAIAPFAWTRMTQSIPVTDEASQARVERASRMKAGHIAPLAVWLASEAAAEVSGQIFGVRAGEMMVFTLPQPTRSVHRQGGWSAEDVGAQVIPALKNYFTPVSASAAIFPYDPLD